MNRKEQQKHAVSCVDKVSLLSVSIVILSQASMVCDISTGCHCWLPID